MFPCLLFRAPTHRKAAFWSKQLQDQPQKKRERSPVQHDLVDRVFCDQGEGKPINALTLSSHMALHALSYNDEDGSEVGAEQCIGLLEGQSCTAEIPRPMLPSVPRCRSIRCRIPPLSRSPSTLLAVERDRAV